MKQIILNGVSREVGNKAVVKSLRREKMVPGVFYGNGVENTLFSISTKELEKVLNTPNSYIIELDIDGKKQLVVLHAVQFHPVTDEPMHVDFLAIKEENPVTIDIPVSITGNSIGVRQGGKLLVSSRKLKVRGMLNNLPDTLEVDITSLDLGKQITAKDLHYEGIDIVSPKATIICSVKMTRAAAAAAAQAKK